MTPYPALNSPNRRTHVSGPHQEPCTQLCHQSLRHGVRYRGAGSECRRPGRSERFRPHRDPENRGWSGRHTGAQGSIELAAWLRENGWELARRLQGGYAEWIEHGEDTQPPSISSTSDLTVGDTYKKGSIKGTVHDVDSAGTIWVWTEDETLEALTQ